MVLDGESSLEYPVNTGVQQSSILCLMLSVLYINDLACNFICTIAIYHDDTTLYCTCNQASNLWQQVEVASKLESELKGILGLVRKWLNDVITRKTELAFVCPV